MNDHPAVSTPPGPGRVRSSHSRELARAPILLPEQPGKKEKRMERSFRLTDFRRAFASRLIRAREGRCGAASAPLIVFPPPRPFSRLFVA